MNKKLFISLLPVALAATVLFLTIYFVMEQNYRSNANDPQIQMAQDEANNLNTTQGTGFSYGQNVDLSKTLATFNVIYDNNGKLITPTVANGASATLPSGVASYAKKHGEDIFTWNINNTRIAAVVEKFDRGYVLVGRSLKEIDKRIGQMAGLVFIFWLISLVVLYGSGYFLQKNRKREALVRV